MHNLRFNTYPINKDTGYGNAAWELMNKLYTEHEELDIFDNSHNILNFCKPQDYEFGDITIGYTPWESTKLIPGWLEAMQRVDELWTTAQWVADVFKTETDREAWVIGHGIADLWKPLRHRRDESRPFTFVHVGESAVRKGGDILLETWYKYFKDNKDVKLIYKANKYVGARYGDINPYNISNIEIITERWHPAHLWQLYALSDCMVYPSRGEGFGLIPLEAMCCGLPTIIPSKGMGDFTVYSSWPLYSNEWVDVPEPASTIHPGQWMQHDPEEIALGMHELINFYDFNASKSYTIAQQLRTIYSWSHIADQIADRLLNM